MKLLLNLPVAIAISALCYGCADNQVAQTPAPAPVKVAQLPTPTPTVAPTPTPKPSRAERRHLRAEARRKAREERRRKQKEEAEEKRQAESATQNSDSSSSSSAASTEQEGGDELAFKLATIDNGYVEKNDRSVKRFKSLLGQLSSHYNEDQQQISDMTVKSKELLSDAGVTESMENIMEGMNQVMPEKMLGNSGANMQSYKEYVALYVTERRAGKSHDEIISGMRALTGH